MIGNAAYTLAPARPACAASANLVAGRLKAAGFDVAERLDATNGAIGAALIDFAQAVAIHPGAAAVVYFCGYAVNYQDRDFVLPVSATLNRPSDALTEGVLERALGATAAGGANAGPALVLLDLFGLPNGAATAPTATLAHGSTNGRLAIAVALEASGSDAATPAATAFGTVLSQKEVKLPGLIARLLSLMPSGGPSFIGQQEATADLLLIGEPQPPSWAPAPGGTAAAQPTPVLRHRQPHPLPLRLRLLRHRPRHKPLRRPRRSRIRRWQHEVGAELTGTLSGAQATRLVSQQVRLTMGGGNTFARVNRHIPQPQIIMPPARQPQIVMPPARPRPWWQFW